MPRAWDFWGIAAFVRQLSVRHAFSTVDRLALRPRRPEALLSCILGTRHVEETCVTWV